MAKRRGKKTVTTPEPAGEGKIMIELSQAPIITSEVSEKSEIQTLETELKMESLLLNEGEANQKLANELQKKQGDEDRKESRSWSDLFKSNREGESGLMLKKIEMEGDEVVITREDVEPEVKFWQFSLIAYIVGQSIPVVVMVNFLKNRWKGIRMPHVIKHEDGYFILRFDNQKDMEGALAKGIQFFYSKPMIVRKWEEGVPKQEEMKMIPIWIQLPKLPLGYWGGSTLSKIVSKVGDPIKTDDLTAKKLKIEYARLLVNVEVGRDLPDRVTINSEADGYSFSQEIRYEWRPTLCKKCRRWGHKEESCFKNGVKQWQIKKKVEEVGGKEEGKQIVIGSEKVPIPVQSSKGEELRREKDKGKEPMELRNRRKEKDHMDKGTAENIMNNLFQFLSQGKEIELGEPSEPPDP